MGLSWADNPAGYCQLLHKPPPAPTIQPSKKGYPYMRRTVRVCLIVLVACVATAFLVVAWLWQSPQVQGLRDEANNRSPHELIRYLKKRLQGHNKLEAVFLPPLQAAQRRYERTPPAGPLPNLGKGQQARALTNPVIGTTTLLPVSSPQTIRQALLDAQPGTRIVIAPGLYPFQTKLRLGHGGTARAPIVLSAAQPGTVRFAFGQVEGILVDQPHWVFENLDIRGTCDRHDDCEHAFHVVGRGAFTTLRNNYIQDFNAHIKVNGYNGNWPDHGLLAYNTLTNTAARETTRSVVPFDLVGANAWKVQDNLVSNFVKRDGNMVSFGIFMKGASEGGRIERNLVICSPHDISRPGVRVGISFGGGGTDPGVCRDKRCDAYEHRLGLAANNIVAHCNDIGLDVNQSSQITLAHNTLINTSGIGARNAPAQAKMYGNLYEGVAKFRDGAQASATMNETMNALDTFMDADALLLQWLRPPERIPRLDFVPHDFDKRARGQGTLPGALDGPK